MWGIFSPIAWLFAVTWALLQMALVYGIGMPLLGTLVRFRANYTPKRLQLEGEGAEDAEAVRSYLGMLKRTHRIEGWAGLYKGVVPSVLTSLILAVVIAPLMPVFVHLLPNGKVIIRQTGGLVYILSYVLATVPSLLLIPCTILINRSIVTPVQLGFFAPKEALHTLLSPAERAKPLRMYLAPGLALSILLGGLAAPTATLGLVALITHVPIPEGVLHTIFAWGTTIPLILLTSLILTPLAVAETRSSVQPQEPDGESNSIEALVNEAVVELRSPAEHGPYRGLWDCLKSIVAEEGWSVVLRSWWIVALGLGLPLLVPYANHP